MKTAIAGTAAQVSRQADCVRRESWRRVAGALRAMLCCGVAIGCATSAAAQESLDAQFERFLAWWPGSYDNLARAKAAPENHRPTRLQLRAVELPAFGPHVVYGEWQDVAADGKVVRQRFYGFAIDRERNALRLNLHIFPPAGDIAERARGGYADPARLEGLTPDDMFPLPGCDVFFRWQGDHFAGAMDPGACAFQAPGTGDSIYSWSQMRLTAESFEYLDGWFNPDGSVYRVLGTEWTVFERRQQ